MGEDDTSEVSDLSHINYCQAATMVSDTKKQLTAEILERRIRVDIFERRRRTDKNDTSKHKGGTEAIKVEVNELNSLLNEATLSLARILTKQGCVSAKFDDHDLALVRH